MINSLDTLVGTRDALMEDFGGGGDGGSAAAAAAGGNDVPPAGLPPSCRSHDRSLDSHPRTGLPFIEDTLKML